METILKEVERGAEFTLLPTHPGYRAILALPGSGAMPGRVIKIDADTPEAAICGIEAAARKF